MIKRTAKAQLQSLAGGSVCEVCQEDMPSHEWADLDPNSGSFVRCSFKPWVGNRREGIGYNMLMEEIRMHDWDDPYGTACDWYFATAAVLWMESPDAERINGFHPSILYVKGNWEAEYKPNGNSVERTRELFDSGHVRLDSLRRVNTVMARYMSWYQAMGRDY